MATTARADAAPGGIAYLDARLRVPAGWLERLEAAAAADPGPVATVSPLTLSLGETDPGAADTAVRRHAAGLRPRVPAPEPGCMLVTRAGLDLAGPVDAGFAERCAAAGLLHIVADDLLVALPGPPPAAAAPLPEEHEWQRDQEDLEPIGRTRALAGRAVHGLSVTIDGRALSGALAGTQVHALELTAALHRTGALRLRIVVPPDLLPEAEHVLAGLDGLEVLPALGIDQATPRSDIVHRPYQISSAVDAKLLRRVARRRVITHQDLLGYHNPAYHPSVAEWEGYRRLTRGMLAAADLVVAFSAHVAADLGAEDLADAGRIEVVHIGTDHRLPRLAPAAAPPDGAQALAGAPFLVCLGTDLRHKNRRFALELLAALRTRGWEGRLALAGAPARFGGSAEAEAAWLAAHPEPGGAVVDLGTVGEPGKAWLYAHAAAVVYPTVSEGFGLIPFEAAEAGTPCLHAGGTALDELLPGTATLVRWDAGASAERALALLRDPERAAALVADVSERSGRLTWDRTAGRLIEAYEAVLRRPPSAAAATAWAALAAEDRRGHFESLHAQLVDAIGPTGLSLVGHDALLPEDAQRTLAGLARRPLTRGPLLRALSGLRRIVARDGSS